MIRMQGGKEVNGIRHLFPTLEHTARIFITLAKVQYSLSNIL